MLNKTPSLLFQKPLDPYFKPQQKSCLRGPRDSLGRSILHLPKWSMENEIRRACLIRSCLLSTNPQVELGNDFHPYGLSRGTYQDAIFDSSTDIPQHCSTKAWLDQDLQNGPHTSLRTCKALIKLRHCTPCSSGSWRTS